MSRADTALTHGLLRGWPLPEPGESKYDRGAVLVAGGASGTPGAVMLAGLAALRVGAGRLTLGVAESVAAPVATTVPECGVVALPETSDGSVHASAMQTLRSHVDTADVVVLGPGLDDPDTTVELIDALADIADETTVLLDAFCLGVLADRREARSRLAGHLLLTPNQSEAALLLGREDVADDELAAAIAGEYDAVVTCAGQTATPDGDRWTLSTGRPGLATSGSGDVLAGAVAGLVGRGADLAQAAAWATYLHACAGDRLAAGVGPVGYLARELVDELPRVMVEIGA